MSDVLTHDEYKAIAANLKLPRSAFIDGKFRPGSGNPMTALNPATGEPICEIAACNATDVDLAVEKAREAFDDGRWSKMAPDERKNILIRLCKLITRNQRELAVMESLDSGKPISDCVNIDLCETIDTIKWHAELIDKIYDKVAPTNDDAMAMIIREPIGVVAAVLPWNFPLLMMAWKIGPALAAGNTVIIKPAEQTSLTALRLAELAMEAGIPRGVLQVLPGLGPDVGEPLGRHMDIDMVSFTGSTETGRLFLKYSAESNLKKVVLECGGKNPAIVLSDAENLDTVAFHVVNAAFWNMGENCSANSRLIVHKDINDALMEKVLYRTKQLRVGDPLDPKTNIGALIDKDHCSKVASYMEGVSTLYGGEMDGAMMTPAVVYAEADDKLAKEEVFGPVLSVVTVASDEEALKIANDTEYGLTASIFSANVRRALTLAKAVRAGTITVNSYGEGNIATPFGGYKQSGFGGRDNGVHAHDQFTEVKTIWIDLTDPASMDDLS